MNEQAQDISSLMEQVDLYSVLRDLLRNLIVILAGAIAVGMIVHMAVQADFQNTYTSTATFAVTSRTYSSYASVNMSAANSMAESVSNLLNSSLLRKKVCADLHTDTFNAVASASVVSRTNLLTLTVTADTPEHTYRIIRSIISNISEMTQFVSENVVMEVIHDPQVPTNANGTFSTRSQSAKAGFISFLLLSLVVMYLSYRKETIKSEKDLENKLDARSLGMLHHDSPYNSFRNWMQGKKKKYLVTELSARFEFVERYKKIAAHISAHARQHQEKVILVTSVKEHEGKTTCSANLALTLSQQAYRVLLIDGDLRRPSQQKNFVDRKVSKVPTLNDYLSGAISLEEAIIHDKRRGIDLLLNLKNTPNSTDVVSSDRMKQLVAQVRWMYDFIVIDSPPMSLMADAEVLADQSDLSILVVKYDHVLAQDLNDAIDALRDCKAEFVGCILNEVRSMPGSRQVLGSYSRYGHYGRYGDYGRYGRYGKYGEYGRNKTQK